MLAVDTNVVVRLLVKDNPIQVAAAINTLASGPIWIAKTVILETERVLRSVYGYTGESVHGALVALVGFHNVHLEDPEAVTAALSLTEQGLDFADALHLTSRPSGITFVSFDRTLVRRGRRAGITDINSR